MLHAWLATAERAVGDACRWSLTLRLASAVAVLERHHGPLARALQHTTESGRGRGRSHGWAPVQH